MMSDVPRFVDRMKCDESDYMKIRKFELREKQWIISEWSSQLYIRNLSIHTMTSSQLAW